MGNLRNRCLWLLLAYFLGIGAAFAETIPATLTVVPTSPYFTHPHIGGGATRYSTSDEVCNALALQIGHVEGWAYTNYSGGGTCRTRQASGSIGDYYVNYVRTVGCPADAPLSNGECKKYTCPDNTYTLDPLGVPAPTCTKQAQPCPTGIAAGPGYFDLGADGKGYSSCVNGCKAQFSGTWPAGIDRNSQKLYGLGQFDYFGGNVGECTGGGPSAASSAPQSPKPPCQASEGVLTSTSGTVACVPEGTPGKSTPSVNTEKKTETYPDGSTKTTETTTTKDPATGAQSTSEKVTNSPGAAGGTQSGEPGTTTATSDKKGSGGQDGKGDDESSDLCDRKPNLAICKQSSFSGGCDAPPSCEGDAAICAAAKAAHELKCSAEKKDGITDIGDKLTQGIDTNSGNLPDPANPQVVDVSQLTYTTTGGTCPPDLVFNVGGRASTISMANVCNIGGMLGNIGVALSLVIAGFIVVGAIRNS